MKHRQTQTHVYFVGGPFTQWLNAPFSARITQDGPILRFNCNEQYMMAGKAALFNDSATFAAIMAVAQGPTTPWIEVPKAIKALGRTVAQFDEEVWAAHREAIVDRANFGKFSQDEDLCRALLATEDRVIVEGASYDQIWGVGLAWDDPRIEDEANWRGLNLLGRSLMRTRTLIQSAQVAGTSLDAIDPFTLAPIEAGPA